MSVRGALSELTSVLVKVLAPPCSCRRLESLVMGRVDRHADVAPSTPAGSHGPRREAGRRWRRAEPSRAAPRITLRLRRETSPTRGLRWCVAALAFRRAQGRSFAERETVIGAISPSPSVHVSRTSTLTGARALRSARAAARGFATMGNDPPAGVGAVPDARGLFSRSTTSRSDPGPGEDMVTLRPRRANLRARPSAAIAGRRFDASVAVAAFMGLG
jgi:hypothetical protein